MSKNSGKRKLHDNGSGLTSCDDSMRGIIESVSFNQSVRLSPQNQVILINQENNIVECCDDEIGGVAQSLNKSQMYGKQPQELPDEMNDDYNTQCQQKKTRMSTRNQFFMFEDFHSVQRCDAESGCSSIRQSDHHIPSQPHVLPKPSICIHCSALKFYKETKGFCCSDGQVSLKIYDVPQELRTLFTSNSEECVSFKNCVRSYNCNFAMTSFGVHYDKDLCANYNGIYTFRIQGQVYHFINEILPSDNRPYLQLYYFDTNNEIQNRLNLSEKLEQSVVAKLIEIVKTNPYVNFFKSLGTYSDLENRSIRIRCDPIFDQRTYNIPTVSQVAAMWVDGGDYTDNNMRDIIVHCKDGKTHRIQYYFGCYDPLQYPLLFPYGESGWHQGIQRIDIQKKKETFCKNQDIIDVNQLCSAEDLIEKETKVSAKKKARMQVSCREYYCYKLQTFLYRALLATVRSRGMIALATASSGVAAVLLPKGRTAHSQFKIPLQISNESTCSKLHADITKLLVI